MDPAHILHWKREYQQQDHNFHWLCEVLQYSKQAIAHSFCFVQNHRFHQSHWSSKHNMSNSNCLMTSKETHREHHEHLIHAGAGPEYKQLGLVSLDFHKVPRQLPCLSHPRRLNFAPIGFRICWHHLMANTLLKYRLKQELNWKQLPNSCRSYW